MQDNEFFNTKMLKDKELLKRCSDAWLRLGGFRGRRERCKRFAYGDQWGDRVLLPDGRVAVEEDAMRMKGRIPVTNNLIRQLVKGIVGRYRYLTSSKDDVESLQLGSPTPEDELDARALEEFLISGSAFRRIEGGGCTNVSPNRVFFTRFSQSDGSDSRLIGMLHDFDAGEMIRRFSKGDAHRAAEIIEVCFAKTGCRSEGEESWNVASDEGCCRTIEVWEKHHRNTLAIHDPERGDYAKAPCTQEILAGLEEVNTYRRKRGKAELRHSLGSTDIWVQSWLTPGGDLLQRKEYPAAHGHPFVLVLYPYIDGEVHSLVEDLLGQQKYVNRLVTLLDDVISNSAKGVLLFPTDQLPDGFSWTDIRRLWANPGGIIPYKRTSRNIVPQQVHSSGKSDGAWEMLHTQLKIFDEVSGLPGSLRGKGTQTGVGAEAMRRELENGTIAILDLLSAFRAFTERCKSREPRESDKQ